MPPPPTAAARSPADAHDEPRPARPDTPPAPSPHPSALPTSSRRPSRTPPHLVGGQRITTPRIDQPESVSGALAHFGGPGEIDRHQLRDAALGHRDAEQPVHPRHRDPVMGDQQ